MHWTRVGGAVACLIVGIAAVKAQASPWIEPGDTRARHALQKLADRGHLDRSASTWPMMWGSIEAGLARSSTHADALAVASSMAYVGFEQQAQTSAGFRAEAGISATTEPTFVRGFASLPREQGSINFNLQWQGEAWAAGLNPTATLNPEDDNHWHVDGSYLAGVAGNWVLGVGAIDRWWGPGWQSSLILSNNARPIPAVWLNRKDARAPETEWLQWIGPWQFTLFAGELEEERAVAEPRIVGMRLTARPMQGLDLGLSRTIMIGGDGRPDDGSTYWNAFIGRDNGQEGEGNDPGNQLASVDIRYGFPIGQQTMGLYAQMMGEDEAGAFPARKSWLLGVDWTSQLARHDQQWFLEYTNTTADALIGGARPNVTYNHHIYQTGYRYYGRNIASTFEGDARAISLGGFNFLADGSNFGASLTYANLNKDGVPRGVVTDRDIFYSIPADDQDVVILNMSYGRELLSGWLDLHAGVTSERLEFVSGEKDPIALGAEWTYRF